MTAGLRRELAGLRSAIAALVPAGVDAAPNIDSVEWAEQVSGLVLDDWQKNVLRSDDPRLGILCCRQAGKSTVVGLKAADLVRRSGFAAVVSPSLRQSSLLFRKIHRLLVTSGETFRRETASELETARGGLAMCLPGDRPDMLRGLSLRWNGPSLLVVDEASRVRDGMWSVISPMLAAAPLAHQALLSTPAGANGEFHRVMTSDEEDWRRITVTAEDCNRIAPSFLARERVRLGDALYRQEYGCEFIASPGSVFGAEVLAAMFGDGEESDSSESPVPARPNGGLASRFVGLAVIVAMLVSAGPNRLTAIAFSDVTFAPARSGGFQEPALIRYRAVAARITTESECFAVALDRVDQLADISGEHAGEAVRAPAAIVVDTGSMPGADRRLAELVAALPRYRAREITTGRVALKATAPAVGRVSGVIGRAELIAQFNARAVPIMSEDPTDPARGPGKFIPSFRHYRPEAGDLSRAEVQARLSAAERLDPRRILDREDALIDVTDDEVVAASIMMTLTAADLYAPSEPGRLPWKLRGLAR